MAGMTFSKQSGMVILLGLLVLGSVAVNVVNAGVTNGIIFGDSTSDFGTNNALPLSNPNTSRADFPPYGETFFQFPTGRFCNGRLVGDFILQDLSLPFITPYLQRNSTAFHGNNFASAGSGILDDTQSFEGIINLSTQISQFNSTVADLKGILGPIATDLLFKQTLVIFSAGSNDLSYYFSNSTLPATVPLPVYLQSMVDKIIESVQATITAGVKKIIVSGLGPIGCAPESKAAAAIAAGFNVTPPNPAASPCYEALNQAAQGYNSLLIPRLNAINDAGNATVLYGNIYTILGDIITNYQSLGYVENSVACCGSGSFNAITQCGRETYNLCPNPDQHVFWDQEHPTETTYRRVADLYLDGNASYISPINVKQLIQQLP